MNWRKGSTIEIFIVVVARPQARSTALLYSSPDRASSPLSSPGRLTSAEQESGGV
jgi:hypothetical protein